MKKLYYICSLFVVICSCSEAPLLIPGSSSDLDHPVSMALIPSTSLAVVANANTNLTQAQASLIAIDLTTKKLLPETKITIPNFSGRMSVDSSSQRIFLVNREKNSVLVYHYNIPGTNSLPISFEEVSVPSPAKNTKNGIQSDDDPYDIALVAGTNKGELLFVSSILDGSVNVMNPSDLSVLDLNAATVNLNSNGSKLTGLPLISSANFQIADQKPGVGAYRMALEPTGGRLLYVTSSRRNTIHVIDTYDQTIEAVIDLSFLSLANGTRGIAISPAGVAYVAVPTLKSILILDIHGITNNGIDLELVQPTILGYLTTGNKPEAVHISADGLTLYVLNQSDPSIQLFDIATLSLKTKTTLLTANTPSDIVMNDTQNELYIVNYLSNNISVLNATTGAFITDIQ